MAFQRNKRPAFRRSHSLACNCILHRSVDRLPCVSPTDLNWTPQSQSRSSEPVSDSISPTDLNWTPPSQTRSSEPVSHSAGPPTVADMYRSSEPQIERILLKLAYLTPDVSTERRRRRRNRSKPVPEEEEEESTQQAADFDEKAYLSGQVQIVSGSVNNPQAAVPFDKGE